MRTALVESAFTCVRAVCAVYALRTLYAVSFARIEHLMSVSFVARAVRPSRVTCSVGAGHCGCMHRLHARTRLCNAARSTKCTRETDGRKREEQQDRSKAPKNVAAAADQEHAEAGACASA
eukprot:6194716-Pleurochrysis_carterae.AAC.2